MAALFKIVEEASLNLSSKLSASVSSLSLRDYIRLITIVGAYALVRPYLLKAAARFQARDHERELDPAELSSSAAAAGPLAAQVELPDDSTDEGGDAEEDGQRRRHTTAVDWGRTARKRQRLMLRKILEAEEKLRAEEQADDEDKDIEEFLVDR